MFVIYPRKCFYYKHPNATIIVSIILNKTYGHERVTYTIER